MPTPIWQPNADQLAHANLTHFITWVNHHYNLKIKDYPALYEWSVQKSADFWQAIAQFCHIYMKEPWQHVLAKEDKMPGAQWFVGARLNFAENLLRFRDGHTALVFVSEHGERQQYSYSDLYAKVAEMAAALRERGVTVGDRVAALMPNMAETVITMLAASSLGAIFSSCSPDFGADGIIDRFGQITPKVLITVDAYWFKGKRVDVLEKALTVVNAIPSIIDLIVVPYAGENVNLKHIDKAVSFHDFIHPHRGANLHCVALPFDHPLYVLYSSGTTGKPKCIVHSAGGTLIQHVKELILHTDLKRHDCIFYYTTCGWMMWNWLVSSLAVGATVVLFDGSPFYPKSDRLFSLIDEEKISVFGTSAKYLASIEKNNVKPRNTYKLTHLRAILSTGSPLAPESFDYVYRDIKPDVCLASISGGTDIVSCFALGNPLLPVYRGELQCRGLGMAVDIYNDAGQPVRGEKGELVCLKPFPSMPIYFWNDPEQQKYKDAYFSKFPGIWAHGDYAELTPQDGLIIYGRSDAVLNPGGVRIGTAEIYRQVEKVPEVLECVAIGQEWRGDIRIVLFVRMQEGIELTNELRTRIKALIHDNTTPRHVPAKIIQVADIPKTFNNKTAELAVHNVIHGRPVKNRDALANPESLELFVNVPELKNGGG